MPNYQGQLDGLCGPYAIVNAFEHCGVEAAEEIYQTACGSLAARRWPSVLWEGTRIGDLQRMIKKCLNEVHSTKAIKVSYPFLKNPPNSNQEYWKRFDEIFKDKPNARCMILGLTRPSYHWIVAHRGEGSRVSFVDTNPHRPFVRKNRTMLHAGQRNGHPKKWIIDRSELMLFEVKEF